MTTKNISKTYLTAPRRSLISDVVSQSNEITTLEKSIILREGEGKVSSIKPVTGQEKKEKRTVVEVLVVEKGDKVIDLRLEMN